MADGVVLNGVKKEKPADVGIQISYDPETQHIGVRLQPGVIKNWAMAKMVLHGATDIAEQQMREQHTMQLLAQARQREAEEAIAQQVLATKH